MVLKQAWGSPEIQDVHILNTELWEAMPIAPQILIPMFAEKAPVPSSSHKKNEDVLEYKWLPSPSKHSKMSPFKRMLIRKSPVHNNTQLCCKGHHCKNCQVHRKPILCLHNRNTSTGNAKLYYSTSRMLHSVETQDDIGQNVFHRDVLHSTEYCHLRQQMGLFYL